MNYFFTSYESGYHHLVIYVSNLISLGALDANTTKILVVGEEKVSSVRQFADEVEVIKLKHPFILGEDDTLTLLSLNHFNVSDARRIMTDNPEAIDNVYCLITDDEVDRWFETRKKQPKDISFLSCLSDPDLSYCLQNLKNFICQEVPWGKILREELDLPGAIINLLPPFSIEQIDSETQLSLNNFHVKRPSSLLKIMFFTKKLEHEKIVKIVRSLRKSDLIDDFSELEITIWCDPITRHVSLISEILYLKAFLKRRNISFNINYIGYLSASAYLRLLINQDILFCQPRGGASSIRAFIRAGGVPIFYKGSLNQENFL
ncbi:hypothetical protein N9O84_02315 [Gammaproteobacteria bacterium]|nr:hypothetical protein [Gammaproteobacteria bacterium]